MLFNQLNIGDIVYIIEVVGTFKKSMEYNVGTISQVSKPYEEPITQNQFSIANASRRKVLDLTITSNGETKKFTVPEDRTTIQDSTIGITISTNKQDIANIVKNQYNVYKAKKESIAKCDEEMKRCQDILQQLGNVEDKEEDSPKFKQLQDEINELKSLLNRKPQNNPNMAMNKVG